MGELGTGGLLAGAAILTLAYFVRGVAGFGSGLIAVPTLALFAPLHTVVPLVVLLDYAASASQGAANRRDIRWREILPLVPFSALGVVLALFVFTRSDAQTLVKALGAFVILFALYSLSGHAPRRGHSRAWAALAGTSGGMIGTLFGTGGPFYVTYFKARGLDKAEFRATFATVFLLDGAGRLVGYVTGGFFTVDFLALAATALPIMAVALYAGGRVHTRLSQQTFQRSISLLLLGSGILLLLK